MRKTLIEAAIVSSLILIPGFSSYASDVGTTASNFLKIGVGARATAMGGAFTALADDGTALYWNPAGLAQIERTEISAMYNMWFQEVNQGYLSLAFPLLGGIAGLGANYMDMGKIEGRDTEGNPTGDFGASDIQASLGYARNFSSKLMLGISAGMLQDTIAEDKKTAYLGNAGFLFKPTELISVGLACQNIGSKLGEDPLPLTYRGGIALRLKSISIEADAVKPIDDDIYYCAGLEWLIGNILVLRGGYRTGQDVGSGISAGVGLRISKINLDYAYVPYGDLGDTHRVSLEMKF
ncbi:PorV/PorQ family protein [Candidatus Aerophobetes bacterium]|nr:PorV/PorQ family protein [Candidatus Aerophobetes bacterium]